MCHKKQISKNKYICESSYISYSLKINFQIIAFDIDALKES